MEQERLRLGVAGLGRAFMLMLPTLSRHPRVQLVAAADPRPEARQRFAEDFSTSAYPSVEELCADPDIQAVYIATPHQFHVAHVAVAAAHGKHVMVEKPMALAIEDCRTMVEATRRAGVHMLVGHSHSFDAPYLRARALLSGGAFGAVRMITALNFTDFLYRPRRPEELVTAEGGGVVFSQAAHQVDVVRLLGGGRVRSVRAATGVWDPARPTEGAYSAFLTFDDGAFASLTYSGYGRFDTDEFCGWIGEMGQRRDPDRYGAARAQLQRVGSAQEEAALKNRRTYGAPQAGSSESSELPLHNHFGLIVVSCDRADLRPMPQGVMVYGDESRRLDPLPAPDVPRAEVIDELADAVLHGRPPLHTGEWGLATTEVCLAILRSARDGQEVVLEHQVGVLA
jgi:phthalate 4,5-cis-dihydrodiol dehydrogenase